MEVKIKKGIVNFNVQSLEKLCPHCNRYVEECVMMCECGYSPEDGRLWPTEAEVVNGWLERLPAMAVNHPPSAEWFSGEEDLI